MQDKCLVLDGNINNEENSHIIEEWIDQIHHFIKQKLVSNL